jgi:hypothetical protein
MQKDHVADQSLNRKNRKKKVAIKARMLAGVLVSLVAIMRKN